MRTDAIRLTQKQQALLRRQAVQLREKGRSSAEVAQILNVHRKTVSGWWAAYARIGHALFEPGTRGWRVGAQRRLTAVQEHDLRRWGYTPPRPQKRGDRAMRTWLAETYPGIVSTRER